MSKVICDVCGTAYAETATQCPICGCVRSADAKVVSGSVEEETRENGTYTYVKGGRFSKSNVKKRNRTSSAQTPAPVNESRQEKRQRLEKERTDKSNKGLVITVIALLLAIIAVVIYIVVRFFAPFSDGKNVSVPNSTPAIGVQATEPSTEPSTEPTTEPVVTEPPVVLCTGITLNSESVTLEAAGATFDLVATLAPADTTEEITYASSNENVATVDTSGKITAVAAGEAEITVSCGEQTAVCKVVCNIAMECHFNTQYEDEMTLLVGNTFKLSLLDTNKNALEVTFTSKNTSICTVDEDGTVRALGKGSTKIEAEYNGVTYACKVIVK